MVVVAAAAVVVAVVLVGGAVKVGTGGIRERRGKVGLTERVHQQESKFAQLPHALDPVGVVCQNVRVAGAVEAVG